MTEMPYETPKKEVPEQDLRELSAEDADELRAFQEKRRWFESKLQFLEAVAPIDPFAQPTIETNVPLIGDTDEVVYRDTSQSTEDSREHGRLPQRSDLQRWQSERDTLEQEVLDFDDGDLGRMKEKTRAGTQVPLTPPSTHLVEITLDLILLIDRLLSLLRARYELLELTNLRLTWDELRWRIQIESARISADLETAVLHHAEWLKGQMANGSYTAQPQTHSIPPAMTPSSSPRIGTVSIPNSPSTSRHYRRQSLQASQLRSTMTSIRIRHSTLRDTLVKQAGEVMDQMIDRAASLKSLGGMKLLGLVTDQKAGQQEGEGGGAVPEEFLDIQDEVELGVEALDKQVAEGKAVEKWLDEIERYAAVAAEVHTTASSVIAALCQALTGPAKRETCIRLQDELRAAEASLRHLAAPSPLPEAGARTSDLSKYLAELKSRSRKVHTTCVDEVDAARTCLEWYDGVAAIRDRLLDQQRHVTVTTSEMRRLTRAIEDAQRRSQAMLRDPQSHRPSVGPEQPTDGDIAQLFEELQSAVDTATATLVSTRGITTDHHTASTKRPSIVIDRLPKPAPDPARAELDVSASTLSKVLSGGKKALQMARRYLLIEERLLAVREGLQTCEASQEHITEALIRAIDEARWDASDDKHEERDESGEQLLHRVQEYLAAHDNLAIAWKAIIHTDTDINKSWIPDDWPSRVSTTTTQAANVRALANLLERTRKQSEVIRALQAEASDMMSARTAHPGGEHVEMAAKKWADALPSRVAFLDLGGSDVSLKTAAPVSAALAESQERLRRHLNELALRVRCQGAESCTNNNDRHPDVSNSDSNDVPGVHDAVDPIRDGAVSSTTRAASWQADKQARRLRSILRDLRISSLVFPSPADLSLDTRLIPSAPVVRRIADTIADVTRASEEAAHFPPTSQTEQYYLLLKDDISAALAHLPRLRALADFRTAIAACDEACAHVTAQALKYREDEEATEILLAERMQRADAAADAVREAIQASGAVESDPRVKQELARIKAKWAEAAQYLGIFEGVLSGASNEDTQSGTSSFTSPPASPLSATPTRLRPPTRFPPFGSAAGPSTNSPAKSGEGAMTSTSISRLPSMRSLRRFPSNTSLSRFAQGNGTRTTSNPFPDRLTQPTASSRNRTVSDHRFLPSPARKRVDSLASTISRMSISSPAQRRGVSGASSAMDTDSARRRSRLSGASQSSAPAATVKSAGARHSEPYVANQQSELDVAIGNLVNQLKVDVPIRAAPGRFSSASARPANDHSRYKEQQTEDWHDESGRYWIGYAGRAKLCFCRILKSRTVMVRVGGGWMELSKFLMDHFAQMAWNEPEDAICAESPVTPSVIGSATMPSDPVNNSPPHDAGFITDKAGPKPAPSPSTPLRAKPYGLLANSTANTQPATLVGRTPTSIGPTTPLRTPTAVDAALGHGGSPGLVPLHFIRKASDSPPVREKEKERFAGRRNILGKGTPGGTPTRVEEEAG